MRSKALCAGILLAYCVPYVFLGMYGDTEYRTMLLYGLLIVAMGLLCWGCIRIKSFPVLLTGNMLSCAASFICIYSSQLYKLGWYFKPFRVTSLALGISVAALLVQLAAWGLARRAPHGEKRGTYKRKSEN